MNSSSGNSTPAIGEITAASGKVIAIKPDGTQVILEPGDKVFLNDRVVSENGEPVVITTANNQVLELSGQQPLTLTDSVLSGQSSEDDEEQADENQADEEGRDAITEGVDPASVAETPAVEEKASEEPGSEQTESRLAPPDMPVITLESDDQADQDSVVESSEILNANSRSASSNIVQRQQEAERAESEAGSAEPVVVSYQPVAQVSSMVGSEDAPVLQGQLSATDAGGGALTYSLISAPEAGSINIDSDGSFEFKPGAEFDYLAAGENQTVTFVFEVINSQGNRSQASVDITVEGVNDTPEVDAPIALDVNQNDSGISLNLLKNASDTDLNDDLSVTGLRLVSGNEAGVSVAEDGSEVIIDPEAYKYLAVGETETITYEYRVTDSQGDFTIQTASITLAGSNDDPVVQDAILLRTDQDSPLQNIDLLAGASDVDQTDTLSVMSLRLTAGDPVGISISEDGNSLSLDSSAYQHLAAGESETVEYSYQVDDGRGGTVNQTASMTIEGLNDAPTITSATDVAGTVSEIMDGDAGENGTSLTDTGSFTITDVDLSDQQSVSVSAGANGYLGSLTATVADDTQGDGSGRIDWSFSVDDADVDYLSAGETLNQTYTVTVDDGKGGTVDQQVTITLTGTNDAPTISSATDVAGMVTEIVDGGAGENSNTLTDNGSFTIADVDLSDQQSVSVSAGANGYLGSLTATVADDTQGDGSGRIDWSFSVDDADVDYLSAGETLNQTYTVTVDDGKGGTVDQQVTITLTGTNDAPTISSATDVAGMVTEIVDGGAGENSNTLTDNGSFTIADVDLNDQQSVSVSAGANGYLGSLTATVADDTQGDGSGRIDWSFSVDDADIDYLGVGETLTQTYTVTVDDGKGGTVDQQVTITLTGTNDAPTISSATDVAGMVTEIVDGGAGENSNTLTDNGSFTIADVDLSDQQSVSVSAGANGYLGSLTATVADDTQGDGSGRIDWSFSVDDADVDYLSAGETLNQTYTVTVDDGKGGTVDQQVTITLTGTNDAPTISSATDVAGMVTEIVDGGAGENSNTLTDNGSFTIADVDLNDQQSVSVSASANGYLGSLTATVADDTQGDGSGRIDWSFSVDDADVDYLSAGETLNQTYTVTVDDGKGGTVDQQVTITLTGTNDAPTISSATDVAGMVTEIVDGGAGENSNTLTDNGSFTIADVDLNDQQSVSVSASANGYLGSLTATVADDTQGDGSGRIDWSFSVDDADVDYLSAGETLNQTYTVTVDDGKGGTVDQQVTITLTGTNDAPTISSATDVAGMVTEIVDGGAGENSNTLTDNGSFTIADVDLSDQQSVSVSASANGYMGSLTATVADDTQGDGSGRIDWSFSVDDADVDYLSAGETLTQTYTVTVDDGKGGTVDQQVTITLTGTNDAPTISSATDVAGMVTEIVDGGAGENSNTLTDNGSFTIADVDLSDQQSVSVSAGANGYLGSLTATVADDTQGDGSGRIDWSFSVDDADVDYLSAGETLNQTYTVTVDDGKGGTVDQQVTITLTGTNDAPTISSATDVAGMVSEIVDGGAGENSNTLTDNGSFTIADVDLSDQQSVSVSAGANGYLGSLTATVADDTQGDGSGRIDWSFSVDDADVDYLSAGETLNQTYTVTVDDGKGGTVDQQVTITLTGTNDAPTISSATDVAGMVTEIVDGGAGENSNTLTDNGSFTIADVDLNDQQSVSVSAGANGYLGSLTATVADDTQGDGSGRIDWSFSVDDADIDYLGVGETLTQTYTVTVDDGKGGTVDQQVTITLTGTNDAPTISSATDVAGMVTEIVDGGAGENSNTLTDNGSFTIADVDLSDQQSVSVSAGANGYLGSLTATVADDTQGDGSGRIDWSFSVDDADVDYLSAGETLNQTYTVTVDDGKGGTVDQQVTITLTGTNDAPTISSATDVAGMVTEIVDGGAGENSNTLTDNGSFTIADVDLSDQQSVSVSAGANGYLGSLTATVADDTQGDGSGRIDWSFSVDDADVDYLSAGETLNQTYTVTVDDGKGGTVDQQVTITLTGTNDAPTISSATDVAGMVTEIVDGGAGENSNTLTDNGSFTIADVDLNDQQSVSVSAGANGYLGSLTATVADDTQGDGSGRIDWSFSVDDADIDYLGVGETLTQTYTVTVDDGKGGTVDQQVTITLTGTNDAPTISSATDVAGMVTEIVDGGAGENSNTLTDNGSFTIADVDLNDQQSVSVSAGANGYLGSLTATVADDTQGDGSGRIDWSFSVDDADIDYLSAGETLNQTYTVTVNDGEGGTVDQQVTITITGTNDAPTITSATDVAGAVTEIVDGGAGENSNSLTDTGSFTIADVDLSDQQTVSVSAGANGYLGSLTATVADDTQGDGNGRIDWSFSVDDADIDYLSAGETLNQTYTVTVNDGEGGTVDQQVTITITGTNDAPTITSATDVAGAVTEIVDGGAGENSNSLTDTGSFTIADVDLSDQQTVSVSAGANGYLGSLTATVVDDTQGDGSGRIDWSFSVDDADIDYLSAGETLNQTYTVTVNDGEGGTVDQQVTITITGTNDAPTITSATDIAGAVTEIVDGGAGENSNSLTDTGSFTIADVDLSDQQTVSVSAGANGYLGSLTATVADDTQGDGNGRIDWSFSVDDADIDYLSAGETLNQTYTVTVNDGEGGTVDQQVTITITGTNDAPTITSATDVAGAVTEIVDGGAGENSNSLTDTGSFTIADVDLSDQQTVSVSAGANGYLGSLTATVADDTQGDGSGRIDWSFSVDDADVDYLSAGETLNQTYTVTVNDGKGGTVDQQVTITLTGTNDAPTISSVTDVAGMVTEIVDGGAGENSNTLTDNGSFTIADVDLNDQQSVSVSAGANGYLGSLTATVADDTQGDGSGRIDWSFSVDDADVDHLAAGQTLTQTYTVTVDDGEGGTVDQQVTITLTGTNDAPTISSATDVAGMVTEIVDGGAGENSNTLTDNGSFTIADVDLNDQQSVSVSAGANGYLGSLTATVVDDTQGDGSGRIDWSFSVDDADIDYLSAGETLNQTYTVTVNDGEGGTVDQQVTITITGTNDAPTITSATDVAGAVTEIVDGGAGENSNSLTDTGSFTIADVDLSDQQTVSVSAGANGYLGSLTATVADDTQGDGNGRIDWSFSVDDADIDYLSAGETLNQTYTVTVNDGEGGTVDQQVTITITGTNDAPTITSATDVAGAVTEIVDGGAGENSNSLTDTGSFTIADVDLSDQQTVSVSAGANGYLGSLTATVADDTQGDGSGRIDWSFSVDDADIDYLSAGETLNQTYTVTVNDGEGGTVDQQVTITITGTNDAPTITSATDVAGAVTEIVDGGAGENSNSLTDTGSFTIADVDLSDQQTVSVSAGANGYLGSLTATVVDDTQGDGSGRIDWSFSVDDADIDYLSAGETLNQTYTVTVNDGEGGTVDQQVTITITGTNDAPTITSATDVAGAVTEIVDGGAGENSNSLTDTGSFTIADVDLSDQQTVSVSAGANGYLGSLTATVADDTQGDGSGRIDWSFSVDDADIDYLSAGETLNQTYTVTVNDGEGGTVDQQVTITITGTNDAPTITSATDVAGAVTEIVDGGAGENSNSLTDTGSFTIADVDLSDQQTVSVSAGANGYLGSLTATVADDTQGDGSGRIDWSFSVDDADIDYLSAGETLNQTYTVTVNDGEGGTVDQQVTITITGTNDAPTITSATDVAGMVTEIVDGGAGENSNTLTDNGSFTIADVDLNDQQTVSVSAGANGYLGSLTATVADDTQGDGSGRIDWSFSVDDADVDYLSAGETLNQTYTVTVDDGKGGTVDQQVTITLTGTNDAPTISSATDVAGMVTEIVDGGVGENSNTLTDNGSFTIADVDLNDQQSVSVSAGANGYLGSLTATVADDTQGDGSGRIDWSFSVDDADVDYLSAGETLNQTYTVTVDDGKGGTVDQQVTITLTGTNDAPTISSATDVAGMVTEIVDGGVGENSNTLTDNGSFTIADVDLNDQQSVSVSAGANGYLGSLTATVADDTQGDGSGRIDWSFSVDDADVDYLSAGETLNQTYTVTVDDGKGGTVDQQVTITITGTNDAPTITSATDVAGAVTEIVDGGAGENSNSLTDTGSFTIADVDFSDQQTVSVSAGANGYLGSLTATVADDTQGDGSGRIDWSFSVNDADIDYLGAGQTLTQTYTVTVNDGEGGTVDQQVTITITGTNDAAVINGTDTGSVTEDAGNILTATGSLSVNDVDNGEGSFTGETITGTYGSLTMNTDGSWSYSADNSQSAIQSLGDGDTLTETVMVKSLDGTSHNIVITINGTDDAAVITGADTGSVTEDVGNILTTSGSLSVTDIDDSVVGFQNQTINRDYGSLTIDANGNWSYSANSSQPAIQALGVGDSLTETITVRAVDGTTHDIVITINGSNDAAVITGTDTGTVTEDAGATLTTSGVLSATDTDSGESGFTAATHTGTYGDLTIDANGNWTYSANNNQSAIQALGDGDSLTETITVQSADGTSHAVVITIDGSNDAPTAASSTLKLHEGAQHTFTESEFGFGDVDAGSALASVEVTSLPATGTLSLNGNPVTVNQVISANDISNLVFTADASISGSRHGILRFKVSDGALESNIYSIDFVTPLKIDSVILNSNFEPVISGKGQPGSSLEFTINSNNYTATADGDGNFTYTAPLVLEDSDALSISLTAKDASNNILATTSYSADVSRGDGEDDTLSGGAGYDLMEGGAGSDQISGGAGDDIIQGNQLNTGGRFGELLDNTDFSDYTTQANHGNNRDVILDDWTAVNTASITSTSETVDATLLAQITSKSWDASALASLSDPTPQVELNLHDGTPDSLVQEVTTVNGATYTLEFESIGRSGVSNPQVEVWWDGSYVTTFTASSDWDTFSLTVTGDGTVQSLMLREPGHGNAGPVINNVVLSGLLPDGSGDSGNLIKNGDFSNYSVQVDHGSWQEARIDHWRNLDTSSITNNNYSTGVDMSSLTTENNAELAGWAPLKTDNTARLELDGNSTNIDAMYQQVDTVDGEIYTLTFEAYTRKAGSGDVEIWWGDQYVKTIAIGTSWAEHTVDVTGDGSRQTLMIREVAGQNDGEGTILNNISLRGVLPEVDILDGGSGEDQIFGSSGNDVITGGADSDTITTGAGRDRLVWQAGNEGTASAPAVDKITDFTVGAGGDILDLHNMLSGEENTAADQFIHFRIEGSDTIIDISTTASGPVVQQIVLENTDLSSLGNTDQEIIEQMFNDRQLVLNRSLAIDTVMEDDQIGADEENAVLVSGVGEPGATIQIDIEDSSATTISANISVEIDGTWSLAGNVLDVSSLSDGELDITVTQTDSAGNTTTDTSTVIFSGTAPTLSSAEIVANTQNLVLTFSENMDRDSIPDLADFDVAIDGSAVNVLNISYLNDTQIRLSLDTAVSPSGNLTLDYTPGSNVLQEQVGINPFAALSGFSATVTPDVSAAVRQNMTVEGDQLIIDYNEALDPASVPDVSAFNLSLVGGGSRTVSNVSISGSRMTLTLDSPVGDADIVQLSYSVVDASNNGGGPVQDAQGNDSSDFTSALVENNTDTSVPILNNAVVEGDTLVLTYSEDLNESVSLTGILDVEVAGTSRLVSSATISGNQVTVQLASPVADGESVTFSYSPSSADSNSNNDRVEDLRGFDAAALNHGDVTVSNITDTISPSLSTAEVDGNTVTLSFSEALNANATINPSLFSIVVDGQSESVSSLAINGQQLTLTLSKAITDGQSVTLDYTPPAAGSALDNDRLEDLVGNDTSSIASFSVDNVTNSGGNPEVVRLYSDDADQWYRDGDTITVKVEFSEPVQVTGDPTLQLETGTIDRLATYSGGTGTNVLSFTYTVANPDESADLNALSTSALDLGGGTITDLLGNNADLLLPELNEAGALAQQNDIRIDTVSPTVGLSSSSASSAGILTLSGDGFSSLLSPGESTDTDLTGRLDWSKLSWRVVDSSGSNTDISFSAADIDSALAVNDQQLNIKISSSKLSSMRATSGYGNEGGMDLIRITSDGFFQDAAGNTMNDGNSAGVEIFILPPDGIAPSVNGITSLTADGEYATGSVIRLQVSFDEAVEVTGTPVLLMGTGDNISVARFSSGSGTQELVFEYTVQPGDEAPDLDVLSASALQLNGGTIKDLSGNAAVLTVPVAANSDSLASTADIMIDGSAPDVSITGVTLAPEGANDQKLTINGSGFDALLGSGESVGLSLTGDALSRFDWSKLSIKLKQPDGSFESVSLDASDIGSVEIHNNRLEIVIDEGVNKVLDNNGFSTVSGDTALDISQGFMADRAGNRSTTDALADQAVTVTSNGATVLNVSSDTVDGSYQAGDEILIRVRFSEKVSLQNYDPNNDPLLLLLNDRQPTQADPYGGNAVYVSGDGTREFVFRHTVSAGENIDDLNYRDTSSLTFSTGISAGSLVNGAGSNVSLTLPGTASTESLAGSSDIVIDTDAATTTITSAAYDENNNQLLLKGADFDQLLNNSESATADLSGRLDWSKLVIDIDKDDGITQNVSFSASDVTVARLAGADTLSIQLTDAKATELEGIFGYKGSEDGVDIQAGFLRDLAGNEGAAATSDLTLDYTDIAAPTVLQVRLEDPGQFITGEQVVILVQLSESVNISGIDASDASTYPTLNLNNGAVATYDSGAGSDILRFVYTVGAGNSENSQGLNYASDSALTIPAGVMVFDSAGNSMLATLPPVNSNDALAQTGSAIIDVNAPEITAVNSLTSDGPYNEGKVIQIEVSFTEAVDISGVPALNLDTGGQATYSSGAGTDKLVFNYTIGSGQDSSDLDVSSLDLSNGSITDLAGNSVDVSTLPTGAQANSLASNAALEVDTTNPSLPGLGAVNFWVGSDGYSPGRIFIYSDGNQALNSNEVSQMTPDWSKLYVENTETGERHYFKADDFSASSFERHSSINHEMKIDLNQSGADAFEKNFRGYSDWPDTMVVHVEEGFLVDRAGNGYSFSSPSNGLDMEILSPTDTPTAQGRQGNKITDVRVVSVNDTYKAGEELLIQVDFNHVVKLDYSTTPELRFNIGGTQQTAVLDTNAHLSGEYNNSFLYRYTIQSGDNVTGSISLAASNPIDTVFKEPATSSWTNGAITVNSEQSIALTAPSGAGSLDNNSSDLIIDTTAPLTTIASASYDPDTNQLELSGSNFNDILSGNTAADSAELRLVLDWSKLSYKVNGSLTESFSEDDVLSAKVLDNNKLIIELAAAKADSIETNSGGDYSDDALDISAGFIKDLAGNVSTTDALSAGSVTQSDLKAPDLTSSLASSNELVLGFSEAISGSPSNSDFTVQIDGSARLVTGVAINGQEVTVTFDGAQIDSSEQLLFSYTGSSLSDSSGNDVASISDRVAGFDHSSSAGLDTLIGDIGDDIFTIDHDDVTASGGLGADIFDFNATGTAQNPAELIITDFNTDEGDVLKLDDILVDPSDSLDEHFHFVASGNDTVMEISDTANGDVTKKVTFKDVDLFALGGSDADILNNLMDNNNLDHGS